MPVLKHAKKKLRQDKRRALENKTVRSLFKSLIKKAKANPTSESIRLAVKSIDKAAKNNILHKNKAARLKSSLAKATQGKGTKGTQETKEIKGKQKKAKKSTKSSPKTSAKKTK